MSRSPSRIAAFIGPRPDLGPPTCRAWARARSSASAELRAPNLRRHCERKRSNPDFSADAVWIASAYAQGRFGETPSLAIARTASDGGSSLSLLAMTGLVEGARPARQLDLRMF